MTSVVPELRKLQRLAGPGRCCFCLKALRHTRKQPIVCWSADCRAKEETARSNHRYATTRALRSLREVVAAIGWSTKILERLE